MTKKDYVKLAAALAYNRPTAVGLFSAGMYAWRRIVNDLADVCQSDNPRFNRGRFLVACGALGERKETA